MSIDASILISTTFNNAGNIDDVLDSIACKSNSIEIIAVVQCTTEQLANYKPIFGLNLAPNFELRVFFVAQAGVTKSRNFAINKAKGQVLIFCDDDIRFIDGAIDTLLALHHENQSATFITTKISTDGGQDFKKYKLLSHNHDKISILSVGTIEISVKNNDALLLSRFPEELGAGSKYPSCDEPVFLSRLIDAGGKGIYIPIATCYHPPISSGKDIDSMAKVVSRLIAFRYIFGRFLGSILFIVFLAKNFHRVVDGFFRDKSLR